MSRTLDSTLSGLLRVKMKNAHVLLAALSQTLLVLLKRECLSTYQVSFLNFSRF